MPDERPHALRRQASKREDGHPRRPPRLVRVAAGERNCDGKAWRAPSYTRGVPCAVVFGIKSDGTKVSLLLNESAEEVASAFRGREKSLVDFQMETGQKIWLNPANVLWVESRDRDPPDRESS
jgi:hypothetical protein